VATTYDLVTVGGGIGGAALAERGAHVLVLEHETSSKTVSIARDSYPGGRRSPQIRSVRDIARPPWRP
jgi:choline dehydrogenase-like flavoprotein